MVVARPRWARSVAAIRTDRALPARTREAGRCVGEVFMVFLSGMRQGIVGMERRGVSDLGRVRAFG